MANRNSQLSLVAEWDWPGVTYYYAAGETVTIEGHTYENRIMADSVQGLQQPFIDGVKADFGQVSLTLCNLANDGSATFPFQALDATDDFEDKQLRIRIYDHIAAEWVYLWFGYTTRPEYNPDDYTCTIQATFIWDAVEMNLPSRSLSHGCSNRYGSNLSSETNFGLVPSPGCPVETYGDPSFPTCKKDIPDCKARGMLDFHYAITHIAKSISGQRNNTVDTEVVRDSSWPILYCDQEAKYRAEVVRFLVTGEEAVANFLVSATHPGLPFDEADLELDKIKLADGILPHWLKFLPGEGAGGGPQSAGNNRTVWPKDFGGHTYVANAAARFRLTKDQANKFADGTDLHAISIRLPNGRRLLKSGLPSSNLVDILEDLLRDPILGIGVPGGDFDAAAITDASNYNSTRFNGRVELDTPEPLIDVVQRFLLNFHGFITMNGGKYQIRCKRHDETPVASFGNGQTYYIDKLKVHSKQRDFSETVNTLNVTFRDLDRRRTQAEYYDAGAMIKAGNGVEKRVARDLFLYTYSENAARISAAINLRESLQLNLDIDFEVDLSDWLASGVQAGDIIKVKSPHIYRNGAGQNELFRVESPEINWSKKTVKVPASLYYGLIYAYNADNLGGDISRGGVGNTEGGRPPDVEDVNAYQISFKADDDNPMAMLAADWTYPDLSAQMAADAAEGINSRYPIKAVQLKWRYQSDPFDKLEDGPRVEYPQTHAEWPVPFHPTEIVDVWFVPVSQSDGTGEVGYVTNPNDVTYLTDVVTDTDTTFPVDNPGAFSPGDLYRIGDEIGTVDSVTGTDMVPELDAGVRDTLGGYQGNFDDGTEIGVCAPSHPVDSVDLSTRRFTYPIVSGVTIRNRRNGVLVEWEDVNRERVEWYLVYYSTVASGPTGLDTTNTTTTIDPDWYLDNPKAPPAGINLIRTRHKHRSISWEKLGVPAGTPVYVRVAAQIKRNFSPELSLLASGKHTHGPSEPPADPIAGDIHQDIIEGSNRVRITFDVYASVGRATAGGKTWADVGATFAGLKLQKWNKAGGVWEDPIEWAPAIEDLTTKVVMISRNFHKGSRWRIKRAYDGNDAGNAHSADVLLEFRPGTVSDDLTAITDLQIRTFTDPSNPSVEISAREAEIVATFTQPATPVALEEMRFYKKKSTATKYNLATREKLNRTSYHSAGLKEVRASVTHPRNIDAPNMDYKVELVAADGSVATALLSAAPPSEAGTGGDPTITVAPSFPSTGHIAVNRPIGDLKQTDVQLTPYADGGGSSSWATNGVARIECMVKGVAVSAAEIVRGVNVRGSAAVNQYVGFRLETGLTYTWWWNESSNNTNALKSSGGATFVAGSEIYNFDATHATLGILSATVQKFNVNAKFTRVVVTFSQPAAKAVLLKKILIQAKESSEGTWEDVHEIDALEEASLYSVAGASGLSITRKIKHQRNVNMDYRAIFIPVGANRNSATSKVVTLSSQLTPNESDPISNPATVPAAPVFVRAIIGNGGFSARYKEPADARPYLQYYEFQFSDNSSATNTTARDWLEPDTGAAAVLATPPSVDSNNAAAVSLAAVTKVSGPRFHSDLRKRDLDDTFTNNVLNGSMTLFVRARIIDEDDTGVKRYGNWSVWSAVSHVSTQDRDTDVPSHNHGGNSYNPLDGFGCYTDAQSYAVGNHGGANTLGWKFYAVGSGADEATAIDTFPGKKWSGSAYVNETGNPYDSGNRGIYWNKSLACIETYGQAGSIHYVTQAGTVAPAINCKAPGLYVVGDVWYFVVAIASFNATSLPSASIVSVALFDGVSGINRTLLASISSLSLTNNWKLFAFKLIVQTAFTNANQIWLRIYPPTFTQSTNHRLLFKNGIMQKGNAIPRIWYPGKQESTLDANSGVSLSDSRGLAALYNTAGWGVDGLTGSGELIL